VWWSPCPSRECPEKEEIDIVVDSCIDHCLLLEQNPKIEIIPPPTKTPAVRINNMDDLDDLNFKVSKKKTANQTKDKNDVLSGGVDSTTDLPMVRLSSETPISSKSMLNSSDVDVIAESEEESWVAGSGEAAFFKLDMHADLGDPIEQLGIEIEEDKDENVTDFIQRFGEKLLWSKGVNVTELDEEDLRCGGIVLRHNITLAEERLRELAEDCMVQKCEFLRGGPEIWWVNL
jgi:hypothetical protein